MARLAAAGMFGLLICVGLAYSQPPATPKAPAKSPPAGAPPAASAPAATPTATAPAAKSQPAAPPADEQSARDAVIATEQAFDAAYESHDAEAVAKLFVERAEFTDEDGTIVGRDAIRAAFAAFFAEFPEATIRTETESVSLPTAGVAIEEGHTFAIREPGDDELARRFVITHVREGDSWKIAAVREESDDTPVPASEGLKPLAWLVGDWIDESDDSTVETSCRWSEDGNWLLQDYKVRLHGGPEMSGTQRIGWDASREQVRSWSFDSEGGFLEATWDFDGERWTAQAHGVAADGRLGSGTRVITPLGPDAFLLQTYHRVLDGEALPDNEVTVVRRPPSTDEDAADVPVPAADDAAPATPETPSN